MQHLINLVGQLRDVAHLGPPAHSASDGAEEGTSIGTSAARVGTENQTAGIGHPRISAYNDWSKVEGGLQLLTATARLQDAFACHGRSLRSTLLQHLPPLFGPLYSPHQG